MVEDIGLFNAPLFAVERYGLYRCSSAGGTTWETKEPGLSQVPSKASGYVQLVLVPLVTLRDESLQDKGTPWEDSWTSATLEEVAKQ